MYIDKILWLLAWPVMIALSYYLCLFLLKKLDKQIMNDPSGEDTMP